MTANTLTHYSLAEPTYNGLYTVGTTVGFCERRNVPVTARLSDVTCPDCLARRESVANG